MLGFMYFLKRAAD